MIYLVTSGSYSDYSVDAAFSTREKAEAWIAAKEARLGLAEGVDGSLIQLSRDEWNVEEYELDTAPDAMPSPATGAWSGTVRIAVDVLWRPQKRSGNAYVRWAEGERPRPADARRVAEAGGRYQNILVTSWGETPEHALRSLREIERALFAGTIIAAPDSSLPAST